MQAQQQLQQRLASSSQASCSRRGPPASLHSSRHAPRHKVSRSTFRSRQACRATDNEEDTSLAAAAQLALDPSNDTVYDRMTFASTATPDYEDPQWVEKIDDWEGFWYGTEEDELALQLDEHITPGERSEASLQRARE